MHCNVDTGKIRDKRKCAVIITAARESKMRNYLSDTTQVFAKEANTWKKSNNCYYTVCNMKEQYGSVLFNCGTCMCIFDAYGNG